MSKEREPVGWLETVMLEGQTEPVRVVLEERQGSLVLLRQVDPGEPEPPRTPIYEGDQLALMQAISHMSLNLTAEVGDQSGFLLGIRVVHVHREDGVVNARTLRRDEADTGARVHVRPGETLTFEAGAVTLELDRIDDQHGGGGDEYVPLGPVLLTWFLIGHDQADQAHVRYLLAAARRLDSAAVLFDEVEKRRLVLAQEDLVGTAAVKALSELVGLAESAVIALGRSQDMVTRAEDLIGCTTPVPVSIKDCYESLTAIRNAYEHIEDRALGQVRGELHQDALSIFDHRTLVIEDRIVYGDHTVDLTTQVPDLLRQGRSFLKEAAAEV